MLNTKRVATFPTASSLITPFIFISLLKLNSNMELPHTTIVDLVFEFTFNATYAPFPPDFS